MTVLISVIVICIAYIYMLQLPIVNKYIEIMFFIFRYMGIGLSAQGVNMNRLPGTHIQCTLRT